MFAFRSIHFSYILIDFSSTVLINFCLFKKFDYTLQRIFLFSVRWWIIQVPGYTNSRQPSQIVASCSMRSNIVSSRGLWIVKLNREYLKRLRGVKPNIFWYSSGTLASNFELYIVIVQIARMSINFMEQDQGTLNFIRINQRDWGHLFSTLCLI